MYRPTDGAYRRRARGKVRHGLRHASNSPRTRTQTRQKAGHGPLKFGCFAGLKMGVLPRRLASPKRHDAVEQMFHAPWNTKSAGSKSRFRTTTYAVAN